jgi:lysozyme
MATTDLIDISHHNNLSDAGKVAAAGVLGVFQKTTQGATFVDPTFAANKTKILNAGMLFGAYHFGTAGDPNTQAEFFVKQAGANALLVLDFEGNPQGLDMSLLEAEQFVHRVNELTGHYPGLYSGHALKEALAAQSITSAAQTELSKCWLWIAQYANSPLIPKVWKDWTIWQYTDGAAGPEPHTVAGVGRCDRDHFNGTAAQVKSFWKANMP